MKFTQNNSLNEIVEQAKPEFKLFWSESILQYIPEEMRNQPISSIKTLKTEWFEIPFPMEDILADANAMEHWEQVWNEHPLWDKETFTVDSNDVHSAALMEYFGEHGKEKKNGSRPVGIICPGGGYTDMSFHTEGTLIAERMMKDRALARRVIDEAKAKNPDSLEIAWTEARFVYQGGTGDVVAAERLLEAARGMGKRKCGGRLSDLSSREAEVFCFVLDYLSKIYEGRGERTKIPLLIEEACATGVDTPVVKSMAERARVRLPR